MEFTTVDGETLELADTDLLSTGNLRQLGFTRTAVEKFLTPAESPVVEPELDVNDGVEAKEDAPRPGADIFRPAPKFYSVADIKKAMSDPVVQDYLLKSKDRRNVIDERKQALIKEATNAQVTVSQKPLQLVMKDAVAAYNHVNRGDFYMGTKTPLVLNSPDYEMMQRVSRITVQYIRHNLTNYDSLWQRASRRPGATEVHAIVAKKTAEAMSRAYPQLAPYIDYQVNTRLKAVSEQENSVSERQTA
jgi:hypothetical protein